MPRRIAAALALALTLAAPPAHAATLTNYNVFVFGNMQAANKSIEGALAVGGNLALTNYSIGQGVGSRGPSLLVGGNLNFTGGTIYGDAYVAGTVTTSGVTVSHGAITQGPLPVDLVAEAASLTDLSALIAAQPVNGTTSTTGFTTTLTGTNPGINVFSVSEAALELASTFRIEAPAGSTALINIDGDFIQMRNISMSVSGGIDLRSVLLNFHEATLIQSERAEVDFAMLAPHADFFTHFSRHTTVVVASMRPAFSNSEFRGIDFNGDLPSAIVVATPEPASLALLLPALAALAARRRPEA